MVCPSCGNAVGQGDRFCPHCGTALLPPAGRLGALAVADRVAALYRNPDAAAAGASGALKLYIAYNAVFASMAAFAIYDPYYYVDEFFLVMYWTGFAWLPLLVLTWIFWLWWIYRVNRNAEAMGARTMLTPALSVLVQIIPVVNSVSPLIVMRQTWKLAEDPEHWQRQRVSPIVGVWWLTGLVTVAGKAAGWWVTPGEPPIRLGMLAESVVTRGLLIEILTDATDIIGALLSLLLIAAITPMQTARRP